MKAPADLDDRLGLALVAAAQFAVYPVDWTMCDGMYMRSMRFAIESPTNVRPSDISVALGERIATRSA